MVFGDKIHNTIYVGFGPATIFGILQFPPTNSLVIEKGDSLHTRNEKEVLFGSGGAGAFSDSKLVANPLVGGDIKNITNIDDEWFYEKANTILETYDYFSQDFYFKWMPEDDYEVPSDKLELLKSKVCHIGTDRSKQIFTDIEDYIQKELCPINFNEEVISVTPTTFYGYGDPKTIKEPKGFEIITNKGKYYTSNVVIAVGKRSNLVTKLVEQLKLKSKNNKIQIGVRVEAPDKYLKELVDKFYDYKIVMDTDLGRWRTFCCNAKCAHVAFEKNEDFVSANGHSYADRPNNGLINFGIMGELNLNLDRGEQIKLMKIINNGTDKLLAQNITDFVEGYIYGISGVNELKYKTTVSKDKYVVDDLWNYLPPEICEELAEFILELQEVYDLDGHFFAPEIKITNPLIKMGENFQIYPGLYLAGDCSGYTRSIIQSGISGMVVGEDLRAKE